MSRTAAAFDRDAERLVAVLPNHWKLQATGYVQPPQCYLRHVSPVTKRRNCDDATTHNVAADDDDDLGEDTSVWKDPDQVAVAAQDGNEVSFHLSVVWNETWHVPVLYFDVTQNGTALHHHDTVVDLLQQQQEQQSDNEFVSMEEHPVTCVPSFFLHPCRTSERLDLMMMQSRGDDTLRLWNCMALLLPVVDSHLLSPRMYTNVCERLENWTTN